MTNETTQTQPNNQSANMESSSCTDTTCCPPQSTSPFKRSEAKVGRNDPCPCGNGRKYKKCCGKNT